MDGGKVAHKLNSAEGFDVLGCEFLIYPIDLVFSLVITLSNQDVSLLRVF